VIILPAQFGTAEDYREMIAELEERGHPAVALDLKRFDWLRIAQSIATADYWQGEAHQHRRPRWPMAA
jgi:hypothetical protein